MSGNRQFVPVNFSTGQLLDEDTMNQVNNNIVHLRDQSVDGKYTTDWGGVWDTNIKLMCGRVYIPQQNVNVVYGTVAFTHLFSPGTQPIITTSIISNHSRYLVSILGIGTTFPDHRGFQFKIQISPGANVQHFGNEAIYVMWQAMGF